MRNLFTALGVSVLLLMSGSSVAYAGGRHENNNRPRNEQKHGNRPGNNNHGSQMRPGNNNGNKGDKGHNGHNGNKNHGGKPGNGSFGPGHHGGGNSAPRPGGYNKPAPRPHSYGRPGGPHRPPRVAPAHHVYPDRLGFMVRQATVGCRNISVWEVEPGTFLLRYTRGGVEYLRYVYPNLNRYGSVQLLTPGWEPYSSWLTIPAFQINLWL